MAEVNEDGGSELRRTTPQTLGDGTLVSAPQPESATGLDAELLGALSNLVDLVIELEPFFSGLVRFDLVVDANIMAADLNYSVRNPQQRRTRLQEIGSSGVFRLHTPHWAVSELESSALKSIGRIHGTPCEDMLSRLPEYLESFTIHDAYKWPAPAVKANVDDRDEPYAALARDIKASAILSRDRDIEAFGAARIDVDALIAARLYARAKAAALSMQILGVSIAGLSLWSTAKVVSLAWHQFRGLGPVAHFLVGGGLVFALRSQLGRSIASQLPVVGEHIWQTIMAGVEYGSDNEREASQALEQFMKGLDLSPEGTSST